MAKINAASTVVLCLILASTWMPTSECSEKPSSVARGKDVKFIRCEVCKKVAEHLYHQVKKKREISPQKITDHEIVQMAKNACNLENEEADWIRKIDIVRDGDKLKLKDQRTEGICNCECQTIAEACREVMKMSAFIPDYLNKPNPKPHGMERHLCRNLSEACESDPPPVPEDWAHGEDFVPLPPKEAEVEKNSTPMEGMPVSPSMEVHSAYGEDDGEEDKDEATHLPSKLEKVSSEEESGKGDRKLIERVHAGAVKTGEKVMKFVEKVDPRKWWKGTKKSGSEKNSKTDKTEL